MTIVERPEITGALLYEQAKRGKTRSQLAAFYGLTMGQVGGRIYRYQKSLEGGRPDNVQLFTFNKDRPLTLEGDWCIIGDVHAPTTDYDMAQLVSMVAQKRGITNLLIAGDILNNDIFSVHPKEDEPVPWQQEKAAARVLLQEWMEVFTRIVWTAGNHERRLSKATWGAFGMEEIRDIIIGPESKIEVSRYGYIHIETSTGLWRITHPKKYSKMPIKTGSDIAMRKGTHTWVFHQHHFGISWSECGRYIVVNGGGLFNPADMDYVSLDDTVMAAMVKGFGILENGYPQLFGEEPFTNWSALLEDDQQPTLAAAA